MKVECMNCGRSVVKVLNLGNRFDCKRCGFRLFPAIRGSSLAYVMKRGRQQIWTEVPEGLLAVFREVEVL